MKCTRDALQNFYIETRHKERHIDGPAGVTELMKKYLAVQTTIAPYTGVYSFIASDIQRVDKRMGSPGLSVYSQQSMDPDVFVYIMSTANMEKMYANSDATHIFKQFQQDALPRPKGEQGWETALRKDKWKDVAYFTALNHRNRSNFRNIVRAVVDAEPKDTIRSGKDEFGKLCSVLNRWNKTDNDDPKEVTKEIGIMLNSLSWKDIDNERLFLVESENSTNNTPNNTSNNTSNNTPNNTPNRSTEEGEPVDLTSPVALKFDDPIKWSMENEAQYRSQPVIMNYKTRNGLSNLFPARKAAKQIIVLGTAYPEDQQRALLPFMGKRQVNATQVHPLTEKDEWGITLDALDAQNVQAIIEHPQARRFYNMMEASGNPGNAYATNGNTFVKTFITVHLDDWEDKWEGTPSKETIQTVKRYKKKHSKLEPGILEILK